MQKTFHEAFINTPSQSKCTLSKLNETVNSILEDAGDGYRQLLSRIPERQKEVLYAIATEGKASRIMSAAFIKSHSLTSVQAATRKLMEADLLSVENEVYYVPDILLRFYLRKLQGIAVEL